MFGWNVSPQTMDALQEPLVLLAALFTLGIFSILIKENAFYRLCEHIFIGATAALTIIVAWSSTILPGIQVQILERGGWWELIPIAFGLCIYLQPVPGYRWLARYPVALWVGFSAGMGLTMRQIMPMLTNIRASMLPLVVQTAEGIDVINSINNSIFVLVTLMTLLYFLFTVEKLTAFPALLNSCRWVLMISFGVGFGNTVMGRISQALGRLNFLFSDWLGII